MVGAVLVHGGAGRAEPGDEAPRLAGVARARDAAWAVLEAGGTALEAAVRAVEVLEDDPNFNAGTGSVLNRDGFVEMDAAVMDGEVRAFGAVAAVRDVKNPVRLALEVMRSEHVFLAGEGASRFARERGFPPHDPRALVTPRQLERWSRGRRGAGGEKCGTVGAVVYGGRGVAAATSTGGILDQRVGRVGDTPLPGAGTYAEAGLGAVSATGHGEFFARALAAYRSVAALREHGPQEAVQLALAEVGALGGSGGLILVTADGVLAWDHTTPSMTVAWRDAAGPGEAMGKGSV